jgi:hypothetical protein
VFPLEEKPAFLNKEIYFTHKKRVRARLVVGDRYPWAANPTRHFPAHMGFPPAMEK